MHGRRCQEDAEYTRALPPWQPPRTDVLGHPKSHQLSPAGDVLLPELSILSMATLTYC